jgi:hypothetical protein
MWILIAEFGVKRLQVKAKQANSDVTCFEEMALATFT